KVLGSSITIQKADASSLAGIFEKQEFVVAFSGGVLEHYTDDAIIKILKEELRVAQYVVFTVPIGSKRNEKYFNDSIFRRLLPPKEWQRILEGFNVKKFEKIRSRHEDLLITLES
ncbi:MAG: hypothetical protein AAB538_01835, partial [Patescibacteria group bacterium]